MPVLPQMHDTIYCLGISGLRLPANRKPNPGGTPRLHMRGTTAAARGSLPKLGHRMRCFRAR